MGEKRYIRRFLDWIEGHVPRPWLRVLAFSIAVAIGAVFTNFEKWELKKDIRDCSVRNDTLRGDILKMQAEIRTTQRETDKIKSSLLLLSMSEDNYPAPKWLKSSEGVMLRLNKAYEREFLLPYGISRSDYIGRTDFEIWPEDIARKFRERDRLVVRSGEPITDIETVRFPDGTRANLEVTKYPWTINGTVLGVAGYVDVDFYKGYRIKKHDNGETAPE